MEPSTSVATPAIDDAELLAGLRAGDDAAYFTLVAIHAGRMLSVARRLLPREDDARDAVQDAFLSAFRAIDSFAGDAKLSTWLHRIVVNAALMKLRRRRRRPESSIDDLLPGFLEDGHQSDPAPAWREEADVLIERSENRRLVRQAIEGLPEIYRSVLVLRDIEDFDTEQTAAELELTVAAVKTRLHRARQALKTQLDAAFAGERA